MVRAKHNVGPQLDVARALLFHSVRAPQCVVLIKVQHRFMVTSYVKSRQVSDSPETRCENLTYVNVSDRRLPTLALTVHHSNAFVATSLLAYTHLSLSLWSVSCSVSLCSVSVGLTLAGLSQCHPGRPRSCRSFSCCSRSRSCCSRSSNASIRSLMFSNNS